MLTTILVILLIVWLISALPGPFNSGLGGGYNGGIGLVLIIIIILALTGYIHV